MLPSQRSSNIWRTHHDSRSFPKVSPWPFSITSNSVGHRFLWKVPPFHALLHENFRNQSCHHFGGTWFWGRTQILYWYTVGYIYIIYPSLFLLKFPLLMVEPPLKPTIPVVFNIIECPHYYSKSNPPVLLFKPKCCLLVGYPIGTGP